jgi:isopropanol dehydrogenase (NADP+)
MRAYVLHKKGVAGWSEVDDPIPGPYDTVTRVTMASACTTDVHMIETAVRPELLGKAIGHEAVGVVEQVGELVKDFKIGDRVVLPTGQTDWRHPRAQRGEGKYYQAHSPYYSKDPTVQGTFAELVRTRDADLNLAHIPDNVSDVQAVLVGDMVATSFTAVERLGIEFGDRVLVLGVGPVGLMGVAGAALKGAGQLIAVGSRPSTLDLARHFGATDVVDYRTGPILESVLECTRGEPVDGVLVASGGSASDILSTALRAVKPGGVVANVTGFLDEETVTLPLDVWDYGFKERFLTGVFVKDGREFLERLLALVSIGRLDTSPLATHVLDGWESVDEAIDLLSRRDPGVIKPVIRVGI